MSEERLSPLIIDGPSPDDGVVAENTLFLGFDGKQATAVSGYVAGGRLHSVQGTDGETLYGKLSDGVVTRMDATWIASGWVDKDDPLTRAKVAIGSPTATSIDARAVQIDDAELLGTSGRAPGNPTAIKWSAGVVGRLLATILGAAVPLRPDEIECDGAIVRFKERGAPGVAAAGHLLKIRWRYAERLIGMQPEGLTLDAAAALLMDEVADGSWESGDPLWIRTANGFVRWHSDRASLSYRAIAESRNVDVTGWLPEIPSGGFGRLLLDASGEKTLTIDTGIRSAELAIQDPALMIAIPRTCCDGRSLAVPLLPPDDTDVSGTLCIVTRALAPSEALCTTTLGLEPSDPAPGSRLVLTANPLGDKSQYFAPAKNWVRPPESAANSTPGLARARVLLPHGIKAGVFKVGLVGDLLARGAGDFDRREATSINLPRGNDGAPPVTGPLAVFDIHADQRADYGREIWPHPQREENGKEPAVLRAIYRRSSAQGSFSADRFPPYTATRLAGADVGTQVLGRSRLETPGVRWHVRRMPPGREEAQALRFYARNPGARRGWVEGTNFVGRSDGLPGPVDFLEMEGANTHVRNWLRLSNDTLVPQTAEPVAGGHGPTSPEYYEAQKARPLETRLGDRDSAGERGSLPLFVLQETLPDQFGGRPRFVLTLDLTRFGRGKVSIQENADPIVNRLVIAAANPMLGLTAEEAAANRAPKQLGDPCQLVLTTLNRLYLELEREGDHFVVRRGMVGWSVSGAFNLSTHASVGLEVTEMFDRRDAVLSRTVEFNGALSVTDPDDPIRAEDLDNQKYRLAAYFWAATWKRTEAPAVPTIRVICDHEWSYVGQLIEFTSVQDARCVDGRLDLSADLVLMLAKAKPALGSPRGADSSWQPVRRNLYSVVLDTTLGSDGRSLNKIVAFVTLRHAGAHRFRITSDTKERKLRLIPDWRATERDIVPLFSDLPRPARTERTTWLRPRADQPHRMNAALTDTPGLKLDVSLHVFTEVPTDSIENILACCLVGEIGRTDGIPRWVPSPLESVQDPPAPPAPPAAAPAPAPVQDVVCRLWLFDGPPRMVAEWTSVPAAPAKSREDEAQKILARLGWTREAVLETDPGPPPDIAWKVVDSPLLNREAGIGWFAWPLRAPGDMDAPAEWPKDVLPRTRQVAQYEAGAPRAFAIEVAFADDVPPGAAAPAHAVASKILLDVASDVAGELKVPVKLRSAGLRAGSSHRLVDYNRDTIGSSMFPPVNLPGWGNPGDLTVRPQGNFGWDEQPVEGLGIVLPASGSALDGSYLVVLPNEATGIRVIQSDDDLLVWSQDIRGQKVDPQKIYDPFTDGESRRFGIRMPDGRPFRSLLLQIYVTAGSNRQVHEQRKYFDGGAERLAGLFDGEQQLQAFGTEQVNFYPVADIAAQKLGWRRVAECRYGGRIEGDAAGWYVATVDIEGRFTLYVQRNTAPPEILQ